MRRGREGVRPRARCGERFVLGPRSGLIHCELGAGHEPEWHRSESAGFEWTENELWPLPPAGRPAAA